MTDRFYPLGLQQEEENWKTTYEIQNEMRAYERSPFPPGTSIHQPGARDFFGYSTPGPIAHRLAKPHLTLSEDIGKDNPREHHAVVRTQAPDEHATFYQHDIPEMAKSYHNLAVAKVSVAGNKPISTMTRTSSLPNLTRKQLAPKDRELNPAIVKLDDEHFSYFVPKSMHRLGREKISTHTLSKLKKENPISFPFSGEGTGFKSQGSGVEWWAPGAYSADQPTSYRTAFKNPGFFRNSPVERTGYDQ